MSASDLLFRLDSYVRHRPWCPEYSGPADCTCGLYALHDSILCECGHKINVHTDRDVDDVVGWPCSRCQSTRCRGFRLSDTGEGEQRDVRRRDCGCLVDDNQTLTLCDTHSDTGDGEK